MAPELPNGKGEMEVPMSDEVREFREGQDEECANWVKRHGTSHVLNLKSQSHAVLHEVDCMHIAISPDYRSLGQPKIGARRTSTLRSRAQDHDVSVEWCRTCMM
jgi:hypothetical protein